jgi:hypothetical protein
MKQIFLLIPAFLFSLNLSCQQSPEPREQVFSKSSLQQVTLASELLPHLLMDAEPLDINVAVKSGEVLVNATCKGDTLSGQVKDALQWAEAGTKIYLDLKYRKKGETFDRVHSLAIRVSAE